MYGAEEGIYIGLICELLLDFCGLISRFALHIGSLQSSAQGCRLLQEKDRASGGCVEVEELGAASKTSSSGRLSTAMLGRNDVGASPHRL